MSDAAPLIIILLIVGGVVVWGALTDWTFSGLLPREGAKCTPGDDEKDENAKQYVYDEDNECTFIKSCKTGWEPNSSNTACISPLTGEPCDGSDENAVYKRDTSGECVFDSCITGYQKSDTGCVLIETCDPATTEYDETQDGKCLGDDNEIVDCQGTGDELFKDITFKGGCGTNNIVHNNIELGDTGCDDEHSGFVEVLCNATPGCIGYRTLGSDCSRLMLNREPVCERYSGQVYVDYVDSDLDGEGKLVGGSNTHYLNIPCRNDPDARYEKWGSDPIHPVGGGCNSDVNVHKAACSADPDCVGFQFHTDGNNTNNCSHFLRKKTILPDSIKGLEKDEGWPMEALSAAIGTGFRAVRGHIDHGKYGNPPGTKDVLGNTIQECFDNASENAKVIGIRTDEHGTQEFKNTCWEYGDGYQNYITNEDDLISPESHLMVCRDPTRDIMNKEC